MFCLSSKNTFNPLQRWQANSEKVDPGGSWKSQWFSGVNWISHMNCRDVYWVFDRVWLFALSHRLVSRCGTGVGKVVTELSAPFTCPKARDEEWRYPRMGCLLAIIPTWMNWEACLASYTRGNWLNPTQAGNVAFMTFQYVRLIVFFDQGVSYREFVGVRRSSSGFVGGVDTKDLYEKNVILAAFPMWNKLSNHQTQ